MVNLNSLEISSQLTTTDFYIKLFEPMELTSDQKLALAQRIFDNFGSYVSSELEYQVEDMKDNDELDWEYYLEPKDAKDITKLVIDMIAVPVG